MIAPASSPSTPRQARVPAGVLAAAQRLIADVVLPARGGHPALSFRKLENG